MPIWFGCQSERLCKVDLMECQTRAMLPVLTAPNCRVVGHLNLKIPTIMGSSIRIRMIKMMFE